jgi:hypothetical protein
MRMLLRALPLYGGNAKPYIAKFESHPNIDRTRKDRFTAPWLKVVKTIEEDENPKTLMSLEEAKRAGNAR